jgi:hypothetical protein
MLQPSESLATGSVTCRDRWRRLGFLAVEKRRRRIADVCFIEVGMRRAHERVARQLVADGVPPDLVQNMGGWAVVFAWPAFPRWHEPCWLRVRWAQEWSERLLEARRQQAARHAGA